MVTVKIFSAEGVKELNCFETLEEVPFLEDPEEEELYDDGELTVGTPLE